MKRLLASLSMAILCGCGTYSRFAETPPFGEPFAATGFDVLMGAYVLAMDEDDSIAWLTTPMFLIDLPLSLTVDMLCLPIDLAVQK